MPAILFLLLFLSAPRHSFAAPIVGRRILHQPLLPLNSLPPSQPPSPSPPTPKYPFSNTTPNQSPFFPSDSSPPPPPSPASFASFPANISSLILPESRSSKHTSPKLVAAVVGAAVSAAILVGIAVFFYRRRLNRRGFADDKTFTSDNSIRLFPANARGTNGILNVTAGNSEFLYLGTLVDSRVIDERTVNANGSNGGGGLVTRKPDSPELHPLPPLTRQSSLIVDDDGDEEEFYSPRGSLGGTGSSSLRVFVAEKKKCSETSSSSYSSSSSGSPARSHSISLSPPVSLSPRRSQPKTPPQARNASPRLSNVVVSRENVASSSSASSTPERGSDINLDASLRSWNQNLESSPLPSEKNPFGSPRISNVSDQMSPPPSKVPNLSSSPNASDRNLRQSSTPSLTSSSPSPPASPERNSEDNTSTRSSVEQSPGRAISAPSLMHCIPPPPPAPPRPPAPMPMLRHWKTTDSSTPIAQSKPISVPPALIPPSRPFVLQIPAEVSPIELPLNSTSTEKSDETPKPKLKPLHWDKVRASSDREMVWDHLRSSSFKLNEEMIETLFVVNTPNSKLKETTPRPVLPSPNQENRVLDPKKAQNIAISLRALNVTTEEVCDALLEGNADALGTELLESLLKMAPTKEEERKLKECKDDSPIKLGPAEKFLKALLDIPLAFKRVDAMLYIANFESEVEYLKKSFETLEAACEELRSSRMFLKLLDAVLKTGNRMNVGTNRGDAHAFKLDTLLKLVDVKGADGKTTLLHFVVQEIIRTEGARLSGTNQTPKSTSSEDAKCRKLGLQIVSGLSSELSNVKKAAAMDSDVLSSEVSKLSSGIGNIGEVVRLIETIGLNESSQKFSESMNEFTKMAEEEIIRIQAQESVVLTLVKEITEYFHGNSAKEEAHPFRIFMVVRDFLTILDRVCKEVGTINERTTVSSAHKFPVPVNPMLPQVIPTRQHNTSSDDESASPKFHGSLLGDL
ncbi:formin-like protein 1 [Carya illinoinensis]|uniref:Formin-like protein n=1 Tax=Carya illinoinensis TaxID=32201 RepID=A0A8T1NMG0_CARIL|nr:formin-like protein 1 [Carya illinoinensis]KAG6630951.1 hypothetical protein CIPAW_13G057100 [Carya illinoinensis]